MQAVKFCLKLVNLFGLGINPSLIFGFCQGRQGCVGCVQFLLGAHDGFFADDFRLGRLPLAYAHGFFFGDSYAGADRLFLVVLIPQFLASGLLWLFGKQIACFTTLGLAFSFGNQRLTTAVKIVFGLPNRLRKLGGFVHIAFLLGVLKLFCQFCQGLIGLLFKVCLTCGYTTSGVDLSAKLIHLGLGFHIHRVQRSKLVRSCFDHLVFQITELLAQIVVLFHGTSQIKLLCRSRGARIRSTNDRAGACGLDYGCRGCWRLWRRCRQLQHGRLKRLGRDFTFNFCWLCFGLCFVSRGFNAVLDVCKFGLFLNTATLNIPTSRRKCAA